MPFRCKVGDTAFINDGSGGHRYITITNPNKDSRVVVVNFTTATNCVDGAVLFTSNDDVALFEHPTSVPYKYAMLISIDNLKIEVSRKDTVSDYKKCNQNILKRIIEGAFKSRFTKIEILEELRVQYPNEYEKYCEKDY